jgi:excisionase family DNA binding protein
MISLGPPIFGRDRRLRLGCFMVAFGSNGEHGFGMAPATVRTQEERLHQMTPLAAPPDQQASVEAFSRLLGGLRTPRQRRSPACRLVGPHGEQISLPGALFDVLEKVAELMAKGAAISVVPVAKELTTQQAADLLQVSRQYLVRLVDEGRLACTRTGSHRRLRLTDVLAYKAQRDAERKKALDDLAELSEQYGGYDELT